MSGSWDDAVCVVWVCATGACAALRVRTEGLLAVLALLGLRTVRVCVVLRGLGLFSAAPLAWVGVSETGALSLSVIQNPEESGHGFRTYEKLQPSFSWLGGVLVGRQGKKTGPRPQREGLLRAHAVFPWPAIRRCFLLEPALRERRVHGMDATAVLLGREAGIVWDGRAQRQLPVKLGHRLRSFEYFARGCFGSRGRTH